MLDYLIEFLKSAIHRGSADSGSKTTARQRLQFVLVQDRSTLSNETLEALKNDMIEVISRYVTIDQEGVDVQVQRSGGIVMLVSNIPILGVSRGGVVEGLVEAG